MRKIKQKLKKIVKKIQLRKKACFGYISEIFQIVSQDIKKSIVPGSFSPIQVRIVILAGLIIFTGHLVLVKQYYYKNFIGQVSSFEQKTLKEIKREILQKELKALVKGHPIESMVSYISQKDRKTAAYLVGIAKKESNWGKRKPVLDGEDCYNYWGFRAKRERMGSGGHTCFDNPREAVDAVARRIDQIIERNDVQSAENMIVWKCGSNCAVTGGQAAADKWIADVDMYAKKVLN